MKPTPPTRATRLAAALLALLLCAALPGCDAGILQEVPGELPPVAATPPPIGPEEEITFSAQLYFKTEDGRNLAAEQRALNRAPDQGYAHALVEALCAGPESSSLSHSIPLGLSLSHVEQSAGICSVYLTGTPPGNEQELLAARAALAATLAQNTGASYVELFVNGVQPGYNGRPMGLLAPIQVSLDTYLDDTSREYDSIGSSAVDSEAPAFDSHNVALYFTDGSRSLLVAQARTLGYERNSTLTQVLRSFLELLMQGPSGDDGLESVLPSDMRLDSSGSLPAIRLLALPQAGEGTEEVQPEPFDESLWRAPADADMLVELRFSAPSDAFDEALVYGALVYAVTGLCPRTAGVRIYLDGAAVPTAGALDYFTRADFSHIVGDMVTLAFPESDGSGLRAVPRCLPQELAYDALTRARALFEGSADPGVNYPVFAPEDVLSVAIQGDMAVVNWRAGFLERLREAVYESRSLLPENTREQMVVFGVINTLTELPGVERVWMLEDGACIRQTANLIDLSGPLLRSPGLMLE